MVSVVIAAHDEEAVIGACLDALRASDLPLEVVVSANGCTDRTAAVAQEHGARVVDRPEPGKAAALNAAEPLVGSFPRIYLDADIVVPAGAVDGVVAALESSPGALAAVPRRVVSTRGRPLPVKAYYAVNERLPVYRDGLFGRGMITLSEAGRARFGSFPVVTADDLFVDSLFTRAEKVQAADVEIVVEAPYSTRELVARLVRVRRGNARMRQAEGGRGSVRPPDRWAWLRDVVLRDPRLLPAAVPYLAITLVAGALARRDSDGWGRDASSRSRAGSAATPPGTTATRRSR